MRGHGFLCLIHVEMRTSSLISILVKPLGNHYKEEQKEAFSHIYRECEERGKEKKKDKKLLLSGVGVEDGNLDANALGTAASAEDEENRCLRVLPH